MTYNCCGWVCRNMTIVSLSNLTWIDAGSAIGPTINYLTSIAYALSAPMPLRVQVADASSADAQLK
jgi:hypothetical protein